MAFKISVIIPVYHPKKEYIDRLLDSITRQTMGIEHIEILLISDGDNSPETKEILSAWEKKYPENIVLVFYEENRKPGFARTLGIEYAHGNYIAFADQDDWLYLEMYRVLYQKATEYDTDMAGGFSSRDLTYEYPEQERKFMEHCEDVFWKIDTTEDRKRYIKEKSGGGYWCFIYNRRFLLENNIYFPEGFTYDDNFFGGLCTYHAKRVLITGEYFYHWFVNESSISMKQDSKTHFDRLPIELLLLDEYRNRGVFEEYRAEIEYRFLSMFYFNTWNIFFWHLTEIPYETYLEQRRIIHSEFPDYRKDIAPRFISANGQIWLEPLFPLVWNYWIEHGDEARIKILRKIPEHMRYVSWMDTLDRIFTLEDLTWFKFMYKLLPG